MNYEVSHCESFSSSYFHPFWSLKIMFSNTLSLHSSLNVRDHVSKPYSITGNISMIYTLIFKFLQTSPENKCLDWITTQTSYFNTKKISCFCTDGKISVRINLPLFSTIVPSSIYIHILDGTTVENKGKLILPTSSLHFISIWIEFWFVNKEPKYLKNFNLWCTQKWRVND